MEKKRLVILLLAVAVLFALGLYTLPGRGMATSNDMAGYWAPVQKAMGMDGTVYDDGTLSFDIPRTINVTLDGVRLARGSDLSHEVHMQKMGNTTMIMGEIVVTENEVGATTQKLITAGLNETAIHNHMIRESPHVLYMHFNGYGDPVVLAGRVRGIFDSLSGGVAKDDTAMDQSVENALNTTRLDQIMRAHGKAGGGVYSYSIPRKDNVTENGMTLSPHMDISEETGFQPLGGGKALMDIELTLEAAEVEPVIQAFAANGIEVTALHNHMLTEQPHVFYLHSWAAGDAETLARGAIEALDRVNTVNGMR